MSTESDEKVQSKFPRASLRARNKTLMVTPADVADYQVRGDRQGETALNLEDVFEDSLSTIDDPYSADKDVAGLGRDASREENSQSAEDRYDGAGHVTSNVWESDERREEIERVDESLEDLSPEDAKQDLFAAPDGISACVEELFSDHNVSAKPDPIVRTVRSVQSPAIITTTTELRKVRHELQSAGYKEYVDWKKITKLVGFLVSYKVELMGSYIELREGRLLVTSEQTSSDSCLVIPHESVSPMHAIMRISADGSILILDQLSEHGTRIQRGETGKEESLMGDKSTIHHGDVVIFGECEYHVVVMGPAALKREA